MKTHIVEDRNPGQALCNRVNARGAYQAPPSNGIYLTEFKARYASAADVPDGVCLICAGKIYGANQVRNAFNSRLAMQFLMPLDG